MNFHFAAPLFYSFLENAIGMQYRPVNDSPQYSLQQQRRLRMPASGRG